MATPVVIRLLALLLALAVTACERSVTEPRAELEPELHGLLDEALDPEQGASEPDLPTLAQLFRRSLVHITHYAGRDAARQVLEEIVALREDARSLMDAGDREAARGKLEELRRAMAAVVVRSFGAPAVRRVLYVVARELHDWRERIQAAEEAGHSMDREKRVLRQVSSLSRDARDALDQSDPVTALDYATRASEWLLRLHASNDVTR
jgi:hypothetical protein